MNPSATARVTTDRTGNLKSSAVYCGGRSSSDTPPVPNKARVNHHLLTLMVGKRVPGGESMAKAAGFDRYGDSHDRPRSTPHDVVDDDEDGQQRTGRVEFEP